MVVISGLINLMKKLIFQSKTSSTKAMFVYCAYSVNIVLFISERVYM